MISRTDILKAAIEGFEHQRKMLDETIAELRAELDGTAAAPATTTTPTRKPMSAAAKRRIRQGQLKRWAAVKAQTPTPAAKPKRKLSSAQLKAMRENAKKARAARRAK